MLRSDRIDVFVFDRCALIEGMPPMSLNGKMHQWWKTVNRAEASIVWDNTTHLPASYKWKMTKPKGWSRLVAVDHQWREDLPDDRWEV